MKLDINFEKIEIEFREDMDIFSDLIEEYSNNWEDLVNMIKASICEKDFDTVSLKAHTLKGIVSNFYCDSVRELAYDIEKQGREEDLSRTIETLQQFIEKNQELIKNLKLFISKKVIS